MEEARKTLGGLTLRVRRGPGPSSPSFYPKQEGNLEIERLFGDRRRSSEDTGGEPNTATTVPSGEGPIVPLGSANPPNLNINPILVQIPPERVGPSGSARRPNVVNPFLVQIPSAASGSGNRTKINVNPYILDIPEVKEEQNDGQAGQAVGDKPVAIQSPVGDSEDEDPKFVHYAKRPSFADFSRNVVQEFSAVSVCFPLKFFIRLGTAESERMLSHLERKMTAFYDKYYFDQKAWLNPIKEVVTYGYYAAYHLKENKWVRCWVERRRGWDEDEDTEFGIQLIDHGTPLTVPKKYILPLRQEYLQLPVQAYKAKLAVLEPITEFVHSELACAAESFAEDMKSEYFNALVTRIQSGVELLPYQELSVVPYYEEVVTHGDGEVIHTEEILYDLRGRLECGYRKKSFSGLLCFSVPLKKKRHAK